MFKVKVFVQAYIGPARSQQFSQLENLEEPILQPPTDPDEENP